MTEIYQDTPDNRAELVEFLENVFQEAKGALGTWEERIAHWWDENPFADLDPRRGWVMREGDGRRLVGFLGLIPTCYAVDGESGPAMVPTTWVVEPTYQKESFSLARRLNRLGRERLVVSTTGKTNFQENMKRRGWVHQAHANRRFLPFGRLGRCCLPEGYSLEAGCRIVSSIEEVTQIIRPYQKGKGIEKWITKDYLDWYLRSPGGRPQFVGAVDEQGRLSSYLILAPKRVLGVVPTWAVFDWFTTRRSNQELMCLLSAILERPASLGLGKPWLLRLTEMSDDLVWADVRGILPSVVALNHLHLAPAHLREVPKSWVLAEGDLGL